MKRVIAANSSKDMFLERYAQRAADIQKRSINKICNRCSEYFPGIDVASLEKVILDLMKNIYASRCRRMTLEDLRAIDAKNYDRSYALSKQAFIATVLVHEDEIFICVGIQGEGWFGRYFSIYKNGVIRAEKAIQSWATDRRTLVEIIYTDDL